MNQQSSQDARGPIPPALKRFVWDIQSMVELDEGERAILMIGRDLMTRLLASMDWLPAVFSASRPNVARQFEIYNDGLARFSVVSTLLAGDAALVIAQPGVWEIMGVVSGAIDRAPMDGEGAGRLLQAGAVETLKSGVADRFRLANASREDVAITIHVYGGGIDRLSRGQVTRDGREAPPQNFANDETAPPYDIFSIQTEIRD